MRSIKVEKSGRVTETEESIRVNFGSSFLGTGRGEKN